MLAKSSKFAEDTALPTTHVMSCPTQSHGGTASLKRRQGIIQTVGSLAGSLRLTQPRKARSMEADELTLFGRQNLAAHYGKCCQAPSGSLIVVWIKRNA